MKDWYCLVLPQLTGYLWGFRSLARTASSHHKARVYRRQNSAVWSLCLSKMAASSQGVLPPQISIMMDRNGNWNACHDVTTKKINILNNIELFKMFFFDLRKLESDKLLTTGREFLKKCNLCYAKPLFGLKIMPLHSWHGILWVFICDLRKYSHLLT